MNDGEPLVFNTVVGDQKATNDHAEQKEQSRKSQHVRPISSRRGGFEQKPVRPSDDCQRHHEREQQQVQLNPSIEEVHATLESWSRKRGSTAWGEITCTAFRDRQLSLVGRANRKLQRA